MGAAFNLEVHLKYIHLTLPDGLPMSAGPAAEAWALVGRLCEEHGRAKVLIEAPEPDGKLDTMAAFESGRVLAEHAVGLAIAICFHEHQPDELTTFFKTVAQNRGVRTEFFSDLTAARHWLDVETGENAAGNS